VCCVRDPRRQPCGATACLNMPPTWIWMQIAIVVFVLIGMVIAITKLA
jgi:hypothetical protein